MTSPTRFPEGFLWGAATSAYQIEGSPLADGAGPSIWHRFSHTPGRTIGGAVSDVACDHYRRWAADVGLMRDLGLQAYRFSLAWSRILPAGRGRVNRAGLDFYARLIDLLLEHGITPAVTLYHWDLPAVLDDLGGWRNPDSRHWFTEYARAAFEAFGDRVPLWATLNEPWVIAHDGYVTGCNAPGHRNLYEAPLVSHHLLCAHGAAVQLYRSGWKHKIGLVVNLEPKDAASRKAGDRAAANRADAYFNRQYLDPVCFGRYPDELREMFGDAWPEFPERDMALIRQPLDFIGVNYYTRKVVRHDDSVWPDRAAPVRVPRAVHMETGWEAHPESFTRTLCRVKQRYGDLPLYVMENGAAFKDPPRPVRGRMADPLRVRYYREHLLAAHEAIRQGVDLRGYFAWSLMDNVEWSSGTTKKFGLVHVDFKTQKRTIKASGRFYSEVIRTNGEALEGRARAVR